LWAGEGNCPYWHGVFGGVYLPHIRGAAFSHLIAAEALADAAARDPGPYALGEAADLDGDGHTEVRLATDVLALTVDPGRGGSLVEWDYRPVPRHLGNVLTRRREAYHADLPNAAAAGSPEDVWAEAAGRRVPLHEPGTLPEARRVTVTEGYSGLALTFDLSTPAAVWCFPIFTISNSEGGFEQNFQGAVLLHSWSLDLASGDAWQESTRCQITFQRR